MRYQRIFFFLFFLALSGSAFAQGELLCTVKVNTPQLQSTDRKVFDQLEVSLRDFMNNTKWTNDIYEQEERIKCNFIITIKSENENFFDSELAVQAVRPVYGSGYETPLLSHLDKDVQFQYTQDQPIIFALDATDNMNLTATMAFYAYIILAMDNDTFAPFGGEQNLITAQSIVTNIQNSPTNKSSGWRPNDGGKSRNRYWIMENLLNARVRPYRSAMYTYHRKGLDLFSSDIETGKAAILQALEELDKVNAAYFNSMIIQMFTNAKRDEIIQMWKIGTKPQKDRVIQIMGKIDPSNAQRYKEIGA